MVRYLAGRSECFPLLIILLVLVFHLIGIILGTLAVVIVLVILALTLALSLALIMLSALLLQPKLLNNDIRSLFADHQACILCIRAHIRRRDTQVSNL